MAFLKYAYAQTSEPASGGKWSKVRTASGGPPPNLVEQASEILGEKFDPNNYLLTHATIVCSVDVAPNSDPNIKTGRVLDPNTGRQINRKFSDFRIQPQCDKFINNNNDAWSRPVLMKSYQTFVAGHNFVEHVQKEEESKGRIIDAVCRDLGESVYTDILIATHRRHASLIRDIEAGKLSTLSMGCSVTETICTKCGNVAADETEMCNHIRFEKGNVFYDDRGNQHRIAELCGHETLDPHAGVHFIEASWVATPAFGGAVMRNILKPTGINEEMLRQAARVLAEPPKVWVSGGLTKAATAPKDANYYAPDGPGPILGDPPTNADPGDVLGFDFGDEGGDEGGGEGEEAAKPQPSESNKPLDKLEDDVYKMMLDRVNQKVRDELSGFSTKPSTQEPEHSTGEDIIKQATRAKVYQIGLDAIVKSASSDAHLMDSVARYNERMGIKISRAVYVAALQVGPLTKVGSVEQYAVACHGVLKRTPSLGELKSLMRLGNLLDQQTALNPNTK